MSDPGLSLSRQAPAASVTAVRFDADVTPGAFARDLARTPALQDALVNAVRDALEGRDWQGVYDLVEEHDLEFADASDDVGALLVQLGRGDVRGLWGRLGNGYVSELPGLLPALGRVGTGRRPLDDWRILPRLLAASDAVTPTVTVHVDRAFLEAHPDRQQRETLCALVAELARGADVRLVGSRLTLRRLAREYDDALGGVREAPTTAPREARVIDARERFAPDGPHTATLRALAAQPSETATYETLADVLEITASGLRERLQRLREYDLVSAGYDTADGSAVELRPTGAAYLEAVADAVGTQSTLTGGVSDPFQRQNDPPCTSAAHGEGEEAAADDRHRLPLLHGAHRLHRTAAGPPAAVGSAGEIAVVNHPVEARDDRAAPGVRYLEEQDTVVVSVEYDNPLQAAVTLAHGVCSERVFRDVLDKERLTESGVAARLDESRSLLRGTRCLGYLPDRVASVDAFIDRFREARDDLLALTGDLKRGDHELERDELRSLITREALGLAGTVVHLLDLADVDVVREVRLPGYTQRFNRGTDDSGIDRDTLTRSLATMVAIQSVYGHHTAYRQLVETREAKLGQSPRATVDATDPLGELIGSIVVVGDLGGRTESLADAIRDALTDLDVREDAPEFNVHVPVATDGPGRAWSAQTARQFLALKRLEATRDAVGLLDAYTRTPYDVATALDALAREDSRREVRESEVRFALAHLPADRLLTRDAAPSVCEIVATLLDAARPLDRAALRERGDVSRSSLYRHLPRLEALGLVKDTDEGYRLALAFRTDTEQHRTRRPAWMARRHTAPRDVLYDAALTLVDDPRRAGDPDDPVFGPWCDPPDAAVTAAVRLAETWPWVGDWGLPVVAALLQASPPGTDGGAMTARVGPELQQSALSAASEPSAFTS